jgi:hypothetical protein
MELQSPVRLLRACGWLLMLPGLALIGLGILAALPGAALAARHRKRESEVTTTVTPTTFGLGPSREDAELSAIKACFRIFAELSPEAASRVLKAAYDRYVTQPLTKRAQEEENRRLLLQARTSGQES